MRRIVWILIAASVGYCESLSLSEIMSRVAANQAKSVEARKQFVYRQQELVEMRQSKNKPPCAQRREYTVTPSADGIERRLVSTEKSEQNCQIEITTDSGPHLAASVGSEGDSFSLSLGKTKDGVPRGFFPLTAEEQALYQFKLAGTEMHNGRKAYRVTFQPNKKKGDAGNQAFGKGQVWVDGEEFQPLEMKADLNMGIPLGVRIFLGTNMHGKGFNVRYQRVADGVWFPSVFGGQFSIRALFFFTQNVSVNLTNSEFRHTDVSSKIDVTGK